MKIPNLLEVIQAWKIAAKPTEEQQQKAELRASICENCEFKEYKHLIRTFVCGACGCPISKKIYSPLGKEACPKEKWDV